MGLDEANLDLTNYLNENNIHEYPQIEELCQKIRLEIKEKTKITASCGIAPNKLLAKMGSEINKPNGQFLLKNQREEILDFIAKRPVRKIPGIGSVSEQLLIGLGIHICEDILRKKREVKICFTENAFEFFMKSALGIARCFHEKAEEQKSISVSRTFPTISSYSDMEKKIKELAELLADDLQYLQKLAKHLSVTAKTHKFEIKSKNLILDKYLKSQEEIFELSAKLLKQLWPIDPVRLLSIKLSDLIDEQTLKENSIEKYLIKPLKKKISEENAFHLDHEDDKNIAEEIDRILELENIQNKDSPNFKEEQSEKTENLIHEVQKESFKKESLAISKAKENKIPQYFKCFICNQEINCSGNSIRMNNHIDKCLLDQNKERQEIEGINLDVSTGNIENIFESNKKRKPPSQSSEIKQKNKQKNVKTHKIDNKNTNKNKTLENFFSKKH